MPKITLMLILAATRALRAPIITHTRRRLHIAAASRSDLEGMTVPLLKDQLRTQGLTVGGKKAELVKRLLESAPAAAVPAPIKPAPMSRDAPSPQRVGGRARSDVLATMVPRPRPRGGSNARRDDGRAREDPQATERRDGGRASADPRATSAARAAARPHSDVRSAERCEAEIVQFGPLGASVVLEFRDGRFGDGLILQKELQYLRESRRGAGAEAGEVVPAFATPSLAEGKFDVFLRPPTAEGKARDAGALILAELERRGGRLDVGDKSLPADIAAALPGLSKSVFKNAVGNLYRAKKIVPGKYDLRLAELEEE